MNPLVVILLLFLAAMVLSLLEIVTPSFGLLATGALVALFAAVYMGFEHAQWLGYVLTAAVLVLTPAYIALLIRLLPKSPLGKRLFLKRAARAGGEAAPDAELHESLVGKTGTAETLLRPGGAVRIEGQRVMARAESGVISKDTPVEVIRADPMNVIVRAVEGGPEKS